MKREIGRVKDYTMKQAKKSQLLLQMQVKFLKLLLKQYPI